MAHIPSPGPSALCERCRIRPAVATVRHMYRGRPAEVAQLCEVCLAEGRVAPPGLSPGGFDEFLRRFLGAAGQPGQEEDPETTGEVGPGQPQVPPGQRVRQVDITRFFSDATRGLLAQAASKAAAWGHQDIDTDHLLWALLDDDVGRRLLHRIDVDVGLLRTVLEERVERQAPTDTAPRLAPDTKRVLLTAFEEARAAGAGAIDPQHILLGLARDDDSAAGDLLRSIGPPPASARQTLLGGGGEGGKGGAGRSTSNTPTLDQYGRDLTKLAEDGKLDPVVGRSEEIEQSIEVLSRRTKNNPVLIGDPGVGKTAIVEGIAQCIVDGDVPDTMSGRRLVTLDLAGMLAGTRYRGEFEERLKNVIEEITAASDELLLFIDEVHTIVGAGAAEGSVDAGNMLKPALARGELHVIGATTLDEYRKNIEKDAALERRFQPIMVDEPTVDETIEILGGLRDRYEAFHRVRITDEALTAAAELSDRYLADRFLPDKAIDLIDQAAARVRLRAPRDAAIRELESKLEELRRAKEAAVAAEEYERADELKREEEDVRNRITDHRHELRRAAEVDVHAVAEVVSRTAGVPVAQLTQLERERLLQLEDQLHARVVGQDEAVQVVAEAVRRGRAGLGSPDRPMGSFLFLGPTGVGKTELARALAEALFGDQDLMVRFDMSEFQERHTVSRLVGAPPGYVGYDEAGQLTERVRRRPYSVILLDEVEKAHPDVFNLLLQVFDDGRLTDGQGRTVDFRNTVVIMTSNLGSQRLQREGQPIGFATPTSDSRFEDAKQAVLQEVRTAFRPEFLNRIDEMVVFRPLDREQLLSITELLVDQLRRRLRAQGIGLRVTDAALAWLAEQGYDPDFGARPLRRTIQRSIENELSTRVLREDLSGGDLAIVDAGDDGLSISVEPDGHTEEPFEDWEEPRASSNPTEPGGTQAPRLSA